MLDDKMPDENINIWWLFVSAFVSATLFPGGSEILLAYMSTTQQYSLPTLIIVASLGNTLGGMTSYALGRIIIWRFPAKKMAANKQRAIQRLQKLGYPALLLSWVPIIGDPLCVAAGYLKTNIYLTVLLIAIGKTARYAIIAWTANTSIATLTNWPLAIT